MILINNDAGQLGNKLRLFAHVYATAIDTNQKVCHLYWKANEKLFQKMDNTDFACLPVKLNRFFRYYDRYVIIKRNEKYNEEELLKRQAEKRDMIKARGSGRIYIIDDWYYRDFEALFRYKKRVLQAFRPNQEIERKITEFWKTINADSDIVVGVHMRRGDYRVWNNGMYFYSDEQYKRWMLELAEEVPGKLQFVLCSDESIDLTNFESEYYSVTKAPGSQMEDLYTLSRCDYIMGPPSTYSWWAAFYGDRKYLTLSSHNQNVYFSAFQPIKKEDFVCN